MDTPKKLPPDKISPEFRNWWLCDELRNLGFPQKRSFQSMYYVRPDMLICIDDLSALKSDGHTDFENIFATLVFKPRIEDLIKESPWLHELVAMDDGSIMAYSKKEEDSAYIKSTGRTDPYIRARGADHWNALVNLWIAVNGKDTIRIRSGAGLNITDDSENKVSGTIID